MTAFRLGAVLCDDHPPQAPALVYEDPSGIREITFGELSERSQRLAGSLRELGIEPGVRVAVLLPKSPELVVALLAIWRVGAVHVPLFTAFGPDAAGFRIKHSDARLLITNPEHRHKLASDGLPVILVGGDPGEGDHRFGELEKRGVRFEGVAREAEDLMYLLYTSGTTGEPKGVEVPVKSLAAIRSYMRYGLDLRDGDRFWNMADPGWAYGLWFAITGPLLLGHSTLLRAQPFDAAGSYEAMLRHGITNLAGAPTVYRSLRAAGVPDGFRERASLRHISSAGEPLNADLLEWSGRELGIEIRDHYGQSEVGMVAGFAQHEDLAASPVAGSMGYALPGFRLVVLGATGEELPPGRDGELAVDAEASPLFWFSRYHREPARTAERFPFGSRYYLTADRARSDEEGRLFFASRADDVITSSGYRIGPVEVEAALLSHPSVLEAAVIGVPDELRGELVAAFVVLSAEAEQSEELADQLKLHVKSRLAKHSYPRHLRFIEDLPRTPSGKVRRVALRDAWSAAPPIGSSPER